MLEDIALSDTLRKYRNKDIYINIVGWGFPILGKLINVYRDHIIMATEYHTERIFALDKIIAINLVENNIENE